MSNKEPNLIGRTIMAIRPMEDDEREAIFFDAGDCKPMILVLDNGDQIIASCDPEGNGPGEFFVFSNEGKDLGMVMKPRGNVFVKDTSAHSAEDADGLKSADT